MSDTEEIVPPSIPEWVTRLRKNYSYDNYEKEDEVDDMPESVTRDQDDSHMDDAEVTIIPEVPEWVKRLREKYSYCSRDEQTEDGNTMEF